MSITVPKKLKQGLKKAIIIILGLYVMIGMALYLLQEKILFRPTVLQQDYKFEFSYPYEELFLKTDENAVINAIHFKVENPKGFSTLAEFNEVNGRSMRHPGSPPT